MDVGNLTERERQILELERKTFGAPGAKEGVIRDLFGVSATRYYQELTELIKRPEALAADPVTVKRLLRLRDGRGALRSARRQGSTR